MDLTTQWILAKEYFWICNILALATIIIYCMSILLFKDITTKKFYILPTIMTTLIYSTMFSFLIYSAYFKEINVNEYIIISKIKENYSSEYINNKIKYYMNDGSIINYEYYQLLDYIRNEKQEEYIQSLKSNILEK